MNTDKKFRGILLSVFILFICGSISSPKTMTYLEQLKTLTDWDTAPVLTEPELENILATAALEDANGLAPLHEEWAPTYDLNAAVARGWLIKAARSAALVDEPTAGTVTSKIFDNCRSMARIYAGKRKMSVGTTG
jgi:acyl dehydratase